MIVVESVSAGCGEATPEEEKERRYPAWIVGVDVARRTVTVDEVEWRTGEDAAPNDYEIVDDDEDRRTLPVAADVDVALVRLAEDGDADLDPGTFEELPAYFRSSVGGGDTAEGPAEGRMRLWSNPFWFTVRSGTVVHIEEQYRP